MKDYIIACDVGGTRIKSGIIDTEGHLHNAGERPSNAHKGADALYTLLKDIIENYLRDFGHCSGIALGLTGPVDPEFGVVLLPGKFTDLEGFPIVPKLKEQFNVPVYAENDGRLAAYAERYYGDAKDTEWAVVITLGTGVGSGVIIRGEIIEDRHFLFGAQLGHMVMDASSQQYCLTGNYGTGEIFCSATALSNQVRAAIQRGLPSILSEKYFDDPLIIDFKLITEACRLGDELCLRELDVWKSNLAVLLINATHAYSPDKIILSGGATLASDLFLESVQEKINQNVFRYPKNEGVPIKISTIQEYAGLFGAAAMFKSKLRKT